MKDKSRIIIFASGGGSNFINIHKHIVNGEINAKIVLLISNNPNSGAVRFAEKNNIRFKFNYYFPIRTLNLMRGVLVAEEDNIKSYYIDSIFDTIWQDGLNMNDEIVIQKVLKNLNVNPKTFFLRSTSSLIKDSLRKKTSDAYEKGIFGAPTFVVNDKIFWGQDRIEFALKEANK